MASLQFSNTTTKEGLIQECEVKLFGDNGYGKISGDTNLLYQFTSRLNRALERYWILALTADGTWQIDDTNNTDFNIATTNLVSGQKDYSLGTDQLVIEKVFILDSSGKRHELTPYDEYASDSKSILEDTTNTGTPSKYNKRGSSLIFDVTPNYSYAAGVVVYFKRGPSYFTYTDTTKTAGVPTILSPYLAINACTGYAIDRTLATAKNFFEQNAEMETQVKTFHTRRMKDEKPRITSTQHSTR